MRFMGTGLGKEALFRQLFAAEYQKLCRYAFSFLQDEQTSEDVVQETFIKIWQQKQELIGAQEIRFYLINAVRNNCISYLRKRKNQPVQFTDSTPEPEPEPVITRAAQMELLDEQQRKVAEALEQLPPKCKEIFLLIKLHGLSYKEAAASLELSVKTIENQMGKAIKLLREFALTPSVWLYLFIFIRQLLSNIGVFRPSSVF